LSEQQSKRQTRLSQTIEAKPSDFEVLAAQVPSATSLALGVLDRYAIPVCEFEDSSSQIGSYGFHLHPILEFKSKEEDQYFKIIRSFNMSKNSNL
jgi:hypothetical protein